MVASASICPRSWDTWAASHKGDGHQTCCSPGHPVLPALPQHILAEPRATPVGRAWTREEWRLFQLSCQLPTPLPPCRVISAPGDSHQGKGHADHRGETEADLDGFSEMLGPVHVQAEN